MKNQTQEIQEFLYLCPETGMTICMIADADGFRPATAHDELASIPNHLLVQMQDEKAFNHLSQSSVSEADLRSSTFYEQAALDNMMRQYEHAYETPLHTTP